jgi:SAM-dependent methyltransferase
MNSDDRWEEWNSWNVPSYPHAKVIQFCLRNYPKEVRSQVRALDLGCGSGVNTAFLAREGFPVTGTDLSTKGLENTRRRLLAAGLEAQLKLGGIDALDFAAESFDLIICVGVLDASGPVAAAAAVRESARLLALSGRGVFIFASERDHRLHGANEYGLSGYTRTEVEGFFAHGFATVLIDRYITTFGGGQTEANDWLVTVQK